MSQEKKTKDTKANKSLFSKKNTTKTVKLDKNGKPIKKKPMDTSTLIIIVGCAVIAIPILLFGGILISASLNTGTPITGDRLKGDLDPAITKSDITSIETSMKSINGVDDVKIELKVATLRIYLDTTDVMTPEVAEEIGNEAYDKLLTLLGKSTYFTSTGSKKMYDIEIHVYNDSVNTESDNFVYVIVSKNSTMNDPIARLVSEPLDAELAAQILDELDRKRHPEKYENEDEDLEVGGNDNEVEGEGDDEELDG